jgi:serine beta-lactamase-like protein LACTB, mitochondrial
MIRTASLWIVFVVALLVQPLSAADFPAPRLAPELVSAVDRVVRAKMEEQQVVGLALGVIREGRIAYLNGYGSADRENAVPVSSETLFRWASCSKPLTAIAALQLVESGKLDLDADVRGYVPEFPDKDVTITSRHLLCHQSGIVHYRNGRVIRTRRSYDVPNPFENVILALDTFQESPLLHPPSEQWSYTTHGYILMSAVVERAGEHKFADQVHERIIRPLGMTTLQPDYQWLPIAHRAVGYRLRDDVVERSTDTDVSWKLGGGGYLSNIEDFARFAEALINRRLVTAESEAALWEPQKLANGKTTEYGLGFRVDVEDDGRLKVSHGGSQEKVKTRMVLYPREKHGVVVMTNSEWVTPTDYTTAIYTALGRRQPVE